MQRAIAQRIAGGLPGLQGEDVLMMIGGDPDEVLRVHPCVVSALRLPLPALASVQKQHQRQQQNEGQPRSIGRRIHAPE